MRPSASRATTNDGSAGRGRKDARTSARDLRGCCKKAREGAKRRGRLTCVLAPPAAAVVCAHDNSPTEGAGGEHSPGSRRPRERRFASPDASLDDERLGRRRCDVLSARESSNGGGPTIG